MSQTTLAKTLRWAVFGTVLLAVLLKGVAPAVAGGCLTAADEIVADRPDVTDSAPVVPYGSLQAESGVNWTVDQRSDVIDGSETRLRLGVAHCTELFLDIPDYFYALNGPAASGFSDLALSVKRQLTFLPANFDMLVTAGLSFPTGGKDVSSHGWDPYFQLPWSRDIADGWSVSGMFAMTWFTSEPKQNPTLEPTFVIGRQLGRAGDAFVEYAGEYSHERPRQILDGGGDWRITRTQQFDVHIGIGLNSSSPDHFFGVGYSFRLDGLF